MNKKIQNVIVFGVFLLLMYLVTMTQFFSSHILYPSISNENTSFDGLIFDQPVNISNLSVVRSIETDQDQNLYKYDVRFTYTGDDSDLRILNTPVRQIYFSEGVIPSRSNATLKGDFDKVNQSIMESTHLKEMYKIDEDFKFLAKSEIRVPLKEDVGEYAFSIYTEPREFTYQGNKKLSDMGIFITNAKNDKFTDNLGLKEQNLKPVTNTKTQSGTFINSLELINEANVRMANITGKIFTALFIISVLIVLITIAISNPKLKGFTIGGIFLSILTMPRLLDKGLSNTAILLILPLLAYIGYVLGTIIYQPKFRIKSKILKQALGATILFFILSILIFIVPRGF